jgi:flagellar FliJ protein
MNSIRLAPLQTVAESREDEAVRRLLECQRELAERRSRLEELRSYAQDYAAQPGGSTPLLMANRHAFMNRLAEAERVQQQLVDEAQLAVDAERARWLLSRRDVSVLDQLAACYRAREQQQVERREQRSSDELALRRFAAAQLQAGS